MVMSVATTKFTPEEWQPIETAPRDGTPIILAGRYSIHYGWFRSEDEPFPWFLIDDLNHYTRDDGQECIEVNSGRDSWPVAWMPMPSMPAALVSQIGGAA
jgi:hypothetical protein